MISKSFLAAGLAAFFAIISLAVPGNPALPNRAEANLSCSTSFHLKVQLLDDVSGVVMSTAGSSININPDPQDGNGSRTYLDNGDNDDNAQAGIIEENAACQMDSNSQPGPSAYKIRVLDLPDCDLAGDEVQMKTVTADTTVVIHVKDCSGQITLGLKADQTLVGCGGTANLSAKLAAVVVEIPEGATVHFSSDFGKVEPDSTITDADDAATAIFTAPDSGSAQAVITATAFGGQSSITIGVACNPGVAQLAFPTTSCGSTASSSFSWTPVVAGGTQVWLDISLQDNNFVPGTFLSAGPLSPTATQMTWNGLLPGQAHFWRINTLTANGWLTSETGAFVPCGGPALRSITYSCSGGRANVTFHWAPASPAGSVTFLDLSLQDNGWASGSFLSAGPLTGQQFNWNSVLANTTNYWRINTLFGGAWFPSATGSFNATC